MYRFVLYLSGSSALAEDITSETLVRALTARDAIRTATVKAYLFTIPRNLYSDDRRRASRSTHLSAQVPDRRPGLQVEAEAKESLAAALDVLQKLPRVDRAALLMRAQDGLPYEEIAAVLGITITAAKVKVHRARLRLAELMSTPAEHEKEKVKKQ